jgi:hypothetical protein
VQTPEDQPESQRESEPLRPAEEEMALPEDEQEAEPCILADTEMQNMGN